MSEKIAKTLSQEDQTVVANAISSLQELLSMAQNTTGTPAVEDQTTADMTSDQVTAAKALLDRAGYKVAKKIESAGTEAGTQTGKKDTETSLEEVLPEETKDSVDEVAKAIASYLKGGELPVKKSVNPLEKYFAEVNQLVAKSVKENQETKEVLEGILSATGIMKQMQIAEKAAEKKEPVQKSQPVFNQDALGLIQALITKNQPEDPRAWKRIDNTGQTPVAKSLTADIGGGVTPLHLLVGGGRIPSGFKNS